jgi:hypothetical protein
MIALGGIFLPRTRTWKIPCESSCFNYQKNASTNPCHWDLTSHLSKLWRVREGYFFPLLHRAWLLVDSINRFVEGVCVHDFSAGRCYLQTDIFQASFIVRRIKAPTFWFLANFFGFLVDFLSDIGGSSFIHKNAVVVHNITLSLKYQSPDISFGVERASINSKYHLHRWCQIPAQLLWSTSLGLK